jgi:uncharacterized protein (DUF924 family)
MPSAATWAADVLSFWFETLTPAQWFKKDDGVDIQIRQRFLDVFERVAMTADAGLLTNVRHARAALIVPDQFPRNIFRGSARSFATDAKALRLADAAVARGFDHGLTRDERLFMYLPFEHSEDLATQERSMALISALGDPELTRFAVAHRDIIARFGRFPHRNAVLGRASTHDEIEFLVSCLRIAD